jgi:hypothetical protein
MSAIGFSCLVYQQDLLFSLSPKVGSPFAENAVATPAARTQARCSFGESDHLVGDPKCLLVLAANGQL